VNKKVNTGKKYIGVGAVDMLGRTSGRDRQVYLGFILEGLEEKHCGFSR
jgi:hypothetical protein